MSINADDNDNDNGDDNGDLMERTDTYMDIYTVNATYVLEIINAHYLHTYAHATIHHAKAIRNVLYSAVRKLMTCAYEGVFDVLSYMLTCKCQVVMQELGMYILLSSLLSLSLSLSLS